jgi:hypothetical protein
MVELRGSLTGIGLMSIAQLIGELHYSGTLELRQSTLRGALAFDDGSLVGAECGDQHGLQAVAACALELADADFVFVEGSPTLERTMDLGPADLKKLLTRISSGRFGENANGTAMDGLTLAGPEAICPLLGFADDNSRHYSRPTALHRCFAGGTPGLVTAQEQRDLCLAGRFTACARFRNTERPAAAAVVHEPPTLARTSLTVVERPPATLPPAEVPPIVAARAAAGTPTPIVADASTSSIPYGEAPAEVPTTPGGPPARDAAIVFSRFRVPRSLLLAAGAAAGVLLVALFMQFVLPSPGSSAPQETAAQSLKQPAVPTAAPTTGPTTAPTSVPLAQQGFVTLPPVVVEQPTSVPTPLPTLPPTLASRPTLAASLPSPTALPPQPGQVLMNVRLAAGAADNWVDHRPYATWSAGAYRLESKDRTRFVAVGVPINQVLSDVIVSATFRKTGGPPGGGYGLIVRDESPEPREGTNQVLNAYVLETGDLGEYGVWRRDGDHWIDLVPWTRSATVREGGSPNDLTVRAVGDRLTFTVNGSDLADVEDDTLSSGGVGLFVGGDDNQVGLDSFSVQIPD